uniref:polysaccharide lyase family 7 protein n=1 Tax=Lacinutrix sp. TaxID=1937692 RepID=UPI0025C1F7DB
NPNEIDTALEVLNGLQNWKLNAYSGSLNVNSSNNNGLTYVDNASKSDNNDWFYDENGYAYFKTYPGNATSSGSNNPRTELRELTTNGSNNINWDGTTNTEHIMKWKVRVDNLPPSGKLCFGQIHAESGSPFDDVIRVQVQGNNGQNSGAVTLRINGYVTEELLGSGQSVSSFNFNMNTDYYFELTMKNSIVTLYELNDNGLRVNTLFTSGATASTGNYFKAGCYLQTTLSSHSSSSTYGLVGISALSVSH